MFEDRGRTYYWGFVLMLLMLTISVGFSIYCQFYASPVPDIATGAVHEKIFNTGKGYLTSTAIQVNESLFYYGIMPGMFLTILEARYRDTTRNIMGAK
jgi:hypothetical protein